MSELMVGTVGSPALLAGDWHARKALTDTIQTSAIDHIFLADHISFHTGLGMDGLINAATLAGMMPDTKIVIGVYLLALRHPAVVARQLASLSQSAPGRIVLGVGVGGEDRHEMEICGVDPATRGRRTDHCLSALSGLLSGHPTNYECEFFEFSNALIKPKPDPAVPIVIGGRSEAAIRRAARHGDGWLGVWCSAARFASVVAQIDELAADRDTPISKHGWQHGLQLWAGFADTPEEARRHVAQGMEDMYRVPFEKFEKYTPYGSPEVVADFVSEYVERGARIINIAPCGPTESYGVEGVAKVSELLRARFG